MSLLARAAALVNRLPVGERAVRVGDDRLYVASVDRWLAAVAWGRGWLEAGERRLMARAVTPGMVVVDVGANVGAHTLLLARRVGPSGRVHALEPAPENVRLLARSVREAGLAQVTVHAVAAAARAGEAGLVLSPSNRGDHRLRDLGTAGAVRVRTVALDDLLAAEPRVDFVKIDVQGAEADVLRGLARTLARSPGIGVLCELCPRLQQGAGATPADVLALLAAAGLRPHRIDADGTTAPIAAAAAVAAAARAGHVNVWCRAA